MKLAILETGTPPGDLEQKFGNYPSMFARMLGPEFQVETFDVQAGELPADPAAHGAYLITGSPAGVYDPLPWIAPLSDFIRAANASKMVGICFGHQVMAEALGGHVVKSEKGWGAGLQHYSVVRAERWMDRARRSRDTRVASGPGRGSAAQHRRARSLVVHAVRGARLDAPSRRSPSSSIRNSPRLSRRR